MKIHTDAAEHVAIILTGLLLREKRTRARVSLAAILRISGTPRRTSRQLVGRLIDMMPDYGFAVAELDSGGLGVQSLRALEGAPVINVPKDVDEEALRQEVERSLHENHALMNDDDLA